MLSLIDKGWRVIASGLCFISFSLGGLIASVTVFPFLHLWPGSHYQRCRRVRYCVHKLFCFFIGALKLLGLITVSTHNIELLRTARHCLVLANHPTLIDVVLIGTQAPYMNCVVKGDLFKNHFLRRVLSYAGFINNDSADTLLTESHESLANGDAIVIFPEGSRTKLGDPLHFRRGAANIAVRCDVPILSVFITCRPIMLMKGDPWYKIPERRGNFDIRVREWLDPKEMSGGMDDKPSAARLLTKSLQNYFEEGLKEYE